MNAALAPPAARASPHSKSPPPFLSPRRRRESRPATVPRISMERSSFEVI